MSGSTIIFFTLPFREHMRDFEDCLCSSEIARILKSFAPKPLTVKIWTHFHKSTKNIFIRVSAVHHLPLMELFLYWLEWNDCMFRCIGLCFAQCDCRTVQVKWNEMANVILFSDAVKIYCFVWCCESVDRRSYDFWITPIRLIRWNIMHWNIIAFGASYSEHLLVYMFSTFLKMNKRCSSIRIQYLITICKYLSLMSMYQRSKIHLFCFQTRTNFQQSISVHVTWSKTMRFVTSALQQCRSVGIYRRKSKRIRKKEERNEKWRRAS